MLFLAETKLDDSFPDAQFAVDNYTLWRADRNKHGGGVLAYLRSDVAGDRKPTLEFKDIESVGIEPKTLEMQMKRLMRTTQVSRQSEKILKVQHNQVHFLSRPLRKILSIKILKKSM
ncbi:uncharacterized protein LOC134267896 [Saccostrea cucullata]|uniref:uncharacterized protein LOC134267896 n=1 Tax=Saccostrea cuccullata TaxID=36930 RepID=UPI002ED5EE3F